MKEIEAQIKERHAAGESFESIARGLNDQGIATPSGRGKWSKATVYRMAKALPKVIENERKATPEQEEEYRQFEKEMEARDEGAVLVDAPTWDDPDAVIPVEQWSAERDKWNAERAAFTKLTTEEKLATFRWKEPTAWESFDSKDRPYGVGRSGHDLGHGTIPGEVVKLLSKGLGEDVEALLDRTIREKYVGTGRVDKGKVTKAFRWLIEEVELQRQANLALRWEVMRLKEGR